MTSGTPDDDIPAASEAGAEAQPPPAQEQQPEKKHKTAAGQLFELVAIVAVALGLALGIQAFLVKPYRIPSESMLPTLQVGQRVLVDRIGSHFGSPDVGDVVVFHPPAPANGEATGKGPGGQCGVDNDVGSPCPTAYPKRSDVNFIKRVVAGPGDTIAIVDGHVILNGKRQDDSFTRPCQSGSDCTYRKPITIPAGHWFMMGDNRGESDDSRFWGPIPKKWIIGGAFATYWPPKRIGTL
ncbi:MAG TPA: signal peptidase I [Solirubrobacteraceae bacterium]|nr:signal peptidase I [Solirubrobacteraceae bacterium]